MGKKFFSERTDAPLSGQDKGSWELSSFILKKEKYHDVM